MKQRLFQQAVTDDEITAAEAIECEEIDLDADLMWIWRAWWRLTDCRAWLGGGMGAAIPAPISYFAISDWAMLHDYDDEMTHLLDHCAKEMDRVYIAHMIAKAKR